MYKCVYMYMYMYMYVCMYIYIYIYIYICVGASLEAGNLPCTFVIVSYYTMLYYTR